MAYLEHFQGLREAVERRLGINFDLLVFANVH